MQPSVVNHEERFSENHLQYRPQFWMFTLSTTIQYNTIQYNTIQYNTIQRNAMQCNAIQYNIIKFPYNALSDWLKERALSENRARVDDSRLAFKFLLRNFDIFAPH